MISLIVCTRNRARQLERCLEHIRRLEPPEAGWELVVVDNGSTDDTATRAGGARLVTEPRAGLGRARNRGVAAARGSLLVFTDDDCYVHPAFLREMERAFRDGRLGYGGGRILRHDPTDSDLTTRPETEPLRIPAGAFVPPGLLHGANMAVRRAVLEAVGGFDERFGPGTPFICDDVDLFARASAKGWEGAYLPGPVVYHHHGRKPGRDTRRRRRLYERGGGAYFAKLLLDPRQRGKAFSQWWRRAVHHLRSGEPGVILAQLGGALGYLRERCRG